MKLADRRARCGVFMAIALTVVVAGCGSTAHKRAKSLPNTATTASSTTTIPMVAAPTTTAGPATSPASGPPLPCTPAQIAVSIGQGGAGLGHVGFPLLFTNKSSTRCVLSGYPGAAMLDASGRQVVQAARTPSGYLGGQAEGSPAPAAVYVYPGDTVSAMLEGTDNPIGASTSCPYYPDVLVTPPNQDVSVTLAFDSVPAGATAGFPGCSTPQIHPMVPGRTGKAPGR